MASVMSIVLGAIAFTKRRTLQQKIRASRQAKVSATTKHGQSARQIRGRARIGAERLKGDDDDDDDDENSAAPVAAAATTTTTTTMTTTTTTTTTTMTTKEEKRRRNALLFHF